MIQRGKPRKLYINEIEQIFGLPVSYTDAYGLNKTARLKLLGKSWSVPCVVEIFRSLRSYFVYK